MNHKPTDKNSLEKEARRYAASGLKVRDVAQMLGLPVHATAQLLVGHRWTAANTGGAGNG